MCRFQFLLANILKEIFFKEMESDFLSLLEKILSTDHLISLIAI